MGHTRKRYPPTLKARIVLEILREEKSISELSSEHGIHPYLLRGISITRPNQVWGIDITYIRLLRGWMYIVAVMDWYSRYVVAWEMDQCLEVAFVIAALGRAFTQA